MDFEYSGTINCIFRSSPEAVPFIIQFRVASRPLPREGWESNIVEIANLSIPNKNPVDDLAAQERSHKLYQSTW